MAKVCPGCRSPVTSGQIISIEQLTYHAACFVCFKCKVSCFGKQFAPRGEPGGPIWEIFCLKCDPASGDLVEINYQDNRSKQNKSQAPAQKPVPRKPVPEPEPELPQERTKKIVSVFQQQEEERLRKERLLQLENQQRGQAKDTRQTELERAREIKQRQEEENKKIREEEKKYRQKQAQEEHQRNLLLQQKEQEYIDYQNQLNSPLNSGKQPQYISAPVEIEAEEETLDLHSPPQRQQHNQPPPPPGPSFRQPPPPGPPRGPPPPPSGGPSRGARQPPRLEDDDAPEETPQRNALLDSIRGFKQRSLRPTETNDRSGPLVDNKSDSSDQGGYSSKPGRGPPGGGGRGNPFQSQLAATLAMRGKY